MDDCKRAFAKTPSTHIGGDADDVFIGLSKDGLLEGKVSIDIAYDRQRKDISMPNTEIKQRYKFAVTFFKTELIKTEFSYTFENIKNYLNNHNKKASNQIYELTGKIEF